VFDDDIKLELQEIKIKFSDLESENRYLRQLLNIAPFQKIKIPEEKEVTKNITISTTDSEIETNTLSPSEKINLFRRFFRGREDVHAIRWENKNGRSGYSPACGNEWDRNVCQKPQIKCSECKHQKWLPMTDQVIHDHLTGKKFIGVYPLSHNETCSFLAIDFDKESWQKDAVSFLNACRSFSIAALLERSQSGNGAHIWIFFEEEIPAYLARTLGTALLSKTMQDCHTLKMDSYDRIFPNQDTLPKGGFGNLIALPLQGNRRKQGNSVFLNDELTPHSNPWELLSNLHPLSRQTVVKLITELQQNGYTMDVRTTETDEEKSDPWVSNKNMAGYPVISETLPTTIHIVFSNLIYIPITTLPAKLINTIKKIAAFQNPEFYSAQAMRLSTYGKARVIYCAEEFDNHIGLPRGCEDDLIKLFEHYKITVQKDDKTETGKSIDVNFFGELRDEQKKAFNTVFPHRYGILCAATAFGKTVLAAKIISDRKINTLILVHRQQLLDQWRERLSVFLNIPKNSIGVLGGGKHKLTGNIDIAMIQSLSRKDEVSDVITQYAQVVIDECHHLSAFSFEKVLKKTNAKYVLGLTATPIRKDGHHPIIMMQCGPIRYRSNNKNNKDTRSHIVYCRETNFIQTKQDSTMAELYGELSINETRNNQIFNDVVTALENKRKPILLTERTQHLDWFKEKFSKLVKNIFVLQGGMKSKERQKTIIALSELSKDEERLIIATGQCAGEGFDDPLLDTLFLTLPISWHEKLQQYVGRLHRHDENKKDIIVYDYVDSNSPMLNKMFQKRLKKYKAMGYSVLEK
jgi:superfamily II DNA or RNA helicase